MLWYKAWLETRSRFLISLFGLLVFPSYMVFDGNQDGKAGMPLNWYYHVLHNGHTLIAVMWLAAVLLLMMGGVLREKALGTSSFTLSLPVSRGRLMSVRIFSGFIQAMTLVAASWSAMFAIAIATGRANSVSQALMHVVLLSAGGVVFFAMAVFVSSIVEGEYTAPLVSFSLLFIDALVLGQGRYRAYSTWNFILGVDNFDRATQLLTGISWPRVILNVLFASVLIAASIRAIQRREF